MSKVEDLNKMMREVREKYPDFKIVTATQLPKENTGFCEKINLGESEFDIIIIDHVNLITYER